MRIEYPILASDWEIAVNNTTEELKKEELNARYFGHNNSFGFYPIGRLNSWHGGIHIERSNCVRAIADGKIIAYRMAEDYLLEKGTQRKYSNSFILIQHNYESPGKIKKEAGSTESVKQKLRFYSLYMHLLPKSELEKDGGNNVPDLYAKYLVKTKNNTVARGLKVRMYCEDDTKKSKEHVFVPCGGILKKDTTTEAPENHWMNNKELNPDRKLYGKKYIFCNYNGEVVIALGAWLKEKGDDEYMVKHIIAVDKNTFDKDAVKGTMIFDGVAGSHIQTIGKNKELEIEKTKDKNWYKIKDKNQYVLVKDCLKIYKKLKGDILTDEIQNVDYPVKAGAIIGVPAKYAFEKQDHYNCMHLEVFTDDPEVENFLINNAGDDSKTSLEVPANKTLQKAKPCNFLKKDIKVKILEIKENYTQIGFESIKNVVLPVEGNIYTPNTNGRKGEKGYNKEPKGYHIYDFETVNTYFSNALKEGESNITRMAGGGSGKDPNRIVEFIHPKDGEKYWINSNEVTGEKDTWVTLSTDIKSFYEKEPKDTDVDILLTEQIKVRKLASVKDSEGTEWFNVQGKKEHKKYKGWIINNKENIIEVNPFKWTDERFGWQVLEDPSNTYFYHFGDSVNDSTPKDFVTQVWEKLKSYDKDGDKVLTVNELHNALRNENAVNHVSKLVCKHQSEWDMANNLSSFTSEVDAIYAKGIDQEEDAEEKEQLTIARDAKKVLLEEKIQKLCFWDKIKDGEIEDYTTREKKYVEKHRKKKNASSIQKGIEEKQLKEVFAKIDAKRIPRAFPSSSASIYHFHPIAFVEHMKLITAPTTPPWMEIALGEAKAAKFIKEKLSPTNEMAKKYHTYVGLPKASGSTAWCSSFVSWCLNQAGQNNAKSAGSQSVLWNEGKLFKRITEPVYGCIVLMTNYVKSTGKSNGHGHVTFLYGVDSNGDLICLGGNQGDRLKYSRYYTNKVNHTFTQKGVKVEQKFNGFFLPINYPETQSKQPELVDMTKLNNELAGKTVKSNPNNEKTT
ncbi:TIGR02594 family protein [Tenacibaculum geojense]|uniref:TIGR02594 family protein n=1 Tax=Tenacibaculum geojense TaxID=915352 RepID=A0ABW3JUF4_9FLAO